MKKLLGAALVLVLSLVCSIVLFACNKDDDTVDDAEIAKTAITSIKTMYIDKAPETPGDYEVVGQTKVGDTLYDVIWSVSSEDVDNISDYITVGAMNPTSKLVTISVSQTTVAFNYTLTATVTVGEATESVSFTRKTVAVLSVADVKELGKDLEDNAYYQVGDEAQLITVTGYVVDPGTFNASFNNFNYVYIVDEYSADKDKDSDDALCLYRIVTDSTYLKQDGDIAKGDKITVSGYLQNYKGSSGNLLEVTYYGSVSVTCVGLEKAVKSDAEKVAEAKAAFDLTSKVFNATGETVLPATFSDVKLSWAVKGESSLVNISEGKLNVVALPESKLKEVVTLTVTFESGSVTDSEDIEISIVNFANLVLTNEGTAESPYTVAEATMIAETLTSGDYWTVNEKVTAVHIQGYVVDAGSFNTSFNNFNNVYIVDEYTEGMDKNSEGALLVYRIVTDDTYLKQASDLEVGDRITVVGFIQNYNNLYEVNYYGSTNITCVALTKPEKPANAQIEAVKESLSLSATPYNALGSVALPTSGAYTDVTLSWTSGNTEYVTIDAENNQLNIVKLPDELTEVKLTVTLSCDGETGEKEITISLKKVEFGNTHKGTSEDPLTVADAKSIIATLGAGEYYTLNGVAQYAYIRGYVVTCGTDYTNTNGVSIRTNNVYIADEEGDTDNSLLILSITYDDYYKQLSDMEAGDIITVHGYLMMYNKSGTLVPEISYKGNDNVYCVDITKVEKTDVEALESALKNLNVFANYVATGNVTLPTVSDEEITLSWASKNETLVTVADGVMTIVSIPDTATEVTITATVKLGNTERSRDFTINLYKLVLSHAGTVEDPISTADVESIYATLPTSTTYSDENGAKLFYIKGYITDKGTIGQRGFNNVWISDSADATKEESILVYSINFNTVAPAGSELMVGDLIVVSGYVMDYRGTKEVGNSGSTYPLIASIVYAGITDKEKVDLALSYISIPASATEDIDLPVASGRVEGVTLSFVSNNEAIVVDSDNSKLVVHRSSEDVTVTITVTATCNGETSTKDFTVVVANADSVEVSLSFATDEAFDASAFESDSSKQVWSANGITLTNSKASSTSNVAKYTPIRCYKSSEVKVEFEGMKEIVFYCTEAKYTLVEESIGEVEGVTVTTDGTTVTVTFDTPCNEFTFVCSGQIRLNSIDVKA